MAFLFQEMKGNKNYTVSKDFLKNGRADLPLVLHICNDNFRNNEEANFYFFTYECLAATGSGY